MKKGVCCMAHGKQRVDIHKEIKETLRAKERFGESKYAAKKDGTMKDGIYSYTTARNYNRLCQQFAEYVREVSPEGRYTSLADSFKYAKEYIALHNADTSLSAYTVKAERSALAKLYGCTGADLGAVRERSRSGITRSRERTVISEKTGKEILNPKSRAGHFSESKHPELVSFLQSTGLRRVELEHLRGTQLCQQDGRYYLRIVGKGGRERLAPIRGDVQLVVDKCKAAGSGKVWSKVPKGVDIHHYRSQYATAMYKELARNMEAVPAKERYCCRRDLQGVWYDKVAMQQVSEALGHSRVSVIAAHYLRE